MDWRITMQENGFLAIFQELYICKHSWKIVRSPFSCMVVLQSMWKGHNHCWNFMESGSESATYIISDLSSDGGHPVLVSKEGVHCHTVLDDQSSYRN